jgi:hypothetical protein
VKQHESEPMELGDMHVLLSVYISVRREYCVLSAMGIPREREREREREERRRDTPPPE